MALSPPGVDPRPTIDGVRVVGVRCGACGHVSAQPDHRCRRCLSEVAPARFGPDGSVWAAATVHLAVDHRTPPFTLAYVDLDGGPRVLTLIDGAGALPVGTRVTIVGDRDGDIVVREVADDR